MILKRNRESLQGRPKVSKGAKSATNVYSYSYSFCDRAVIATFDLSATNLDALQKDHWLSNPKNVMVLYLTEAAYVESPPIHVFELPASLVTPPTSPSRGSPRLGQGVMNSSLEGGAADPVQRIWKSSPNHGPKRRWISSPSRLPQDPGNLPISAEELASAEPWIYCCGADTSREELESAEPRRLFG